MIKRGRKLLNKLNVPKNVLDINSKRNQVPVQHEKVQSNTINVVPSLEYNLISSDNFIKENVFQMQNVINEIPVLNIVDGVIMEQSADGTYKPYLGIKI